MMMKDGVTLLLVAVLLAAPSARAQEPEPPEGVCDDDYECRYELHMSTGGVAQWDLQPLCNQGQDYQVNDTEGHTYNFQICGSTEWTCVPEWTNLYEYGVAVQYFGDAPSCNTTHPECTKNSGESVCCSKPCQVLGVGPPIWKLQDTTRPETSGIIITHRSVPPTLDDKHPCAINPNTGTQYQREVTYNITCDQSVTKLRIDGVETLSPYDPANHCAYTIHMASPHACGCVPDCQNKNCGPDGCGGYCGGLSSFGACPPDYQCLDDQVCCKGSCSDRTCGTDGCGHSCGACGIGEECLYGDCVMASPSPIPSGATATATPTPGYAVSPAVDTTYQSSAGTLAGSFIGGVLTAVVIGGGIAFWYNRRNGGGGYTPFSAGGGKGAAAASSSTPAAAAKPSSATTYGASTSTSYGGL